MTEPVLPAAAAAPPPEPPAATAGLASAATNPLLAADPEDVATTAPNPLAEVATDPLAEVGAEIPADLLEALKDVIDPELGVNIVDLGLVYGVDRDDQGNVTVDMTLTSPMCPLTDQLEFDVRYTLQSLATSVAVNWVWLPPWSLDSITDDGREQLRALGYSV